MSSWKHTRSRARVQAVPDRAVWARAWTFSFALKPQILRSDARACLQSRASQTGNRARARAGPRMTENGGALCLGDLKRLSSLPPAAATRADASASHLKPRGLSRSPVRARARARSLGDGSGFEDAT